MRARWRAVLIALFTAHACSAQASATSIPGLVVPRAIAKAPAKRSIDVDDVVAIRVADTLSVSPDGRLFAFFAHQADERTNDYRTGWFVGSSRNGDLVRVGDGGIVRPRVLDSGHIIGDLEASESVWSPDGRWIAYKVHRAGEVQLWRSRADGRVQEQVTHNAADVREFAWADDGQALYFTAGTPRATLRAHDEQRERNGYRYDEDVGFFTDFMRPRITRPLEGEPAVWVAYLRDRNERLGTSDDRSAFERARAHESAGRDLPAGYLQGSAVSPAIGADGRKVWMERAAAVGRRFSVFASVPAAEPARIPCPAEICSGVIQRVWWSSDGSRVFIWRLEGINDRAHGFYAWSPTNGTVTLVLQSVQDDFRSCTPAADDKLICIRESIVRPSEIVALDFTARQLEVLVRLNPEFENIRLGRAERYEWDTPRFAWNESGGELEGLYPERAYGFILYPPNFDPRKKYPVFIDPYIAEGFGSLGAEHPLHVYAANGFIVLRMTFPVDVDSCAVRFGGGCMKRIYAADLDFPHLSMLAASTLRGLDVAAARGFIDPARVGIGGVSHGTFVPLFMLQKYDRIAAISISSPTWGPHEYYWGSMKGRGATGRALGKRLGYEDWQPRPEGEGKAFWSAFDIADHVDAIEAPVLMHLADTETYALLRLMRHMADAGKPYDAYVFRHEEHTKWQPAHLRAIMRRNLDWFRFWLQEKEDSAPAKAEQYLQWRELRRQYDAQRPHVLPSGSY